MTGANKMAMAKDNCLKVSLLLALCLPVFAPQRAFASTVEWKTESGKAQASMALPVSSIASMLLPSGQISINGQSVEVGSVPEWLFDRHTVLNGTLIRLDVTASNLEGLVYFTSGDYMKNLRRGRISETVEAADGNTYIGRISTVTNDSLTIDTLPGQSRTLALGNVRNIVSPYAYRFAAVARDVKLSPENGTTVCEATSAAFSPSQMLSASKPARTFTLPGQGLKLPKSTLAGTEGGISKTAITAMITADAANTIAPMIALPLTMALGQHRAENTLNGYTAANRLNDFVLHIPLVTSPTAKF